MTSFKEESELLDTMDVLSMPDETLVKVLSFVLLKPLLVMDKKALRLNSCLINLIQNILCEVFPENPANFPELENLILLSKP